MTVQRVLLNFFASFDSFPRHSPLFFQQINSTNLSNLAHMCFFETLIFLITEVLRVLKLYMYYIDLFLEGVTLLTNFLFDKKTISDHRFHWRKFQILSFILYSRCRLKKKYEVKV